MLTVRSIVARPVVLKLKRPVVARIATITEWPLVLIDLQTEEGIVGRSYLEPYVVKSLRYLVPMLDDLGTLLKSRRVAPVELFGWRIDTPVEMDYYRNGGILQTVLRRLMTE